MRKPWFRSRARRVRFLIAAAGAMAVHAAWDGALAQDNAATVERCKPVQASEVLQLAELSRGSTALAPQATEQPAQRDVIPTRECTRNADEAGKTATVQSGVTISAVTGMIGGIMGKLDSGRGDGGTANPGPGSGMGTGFAALGGLADGMMALGGKEKARGAPATSAGLPASPFSAYVMGTFLGGNSAGTASAPGFDYGTTAGMVGLEYSVNRNLILGLAAGFATGNADVATGATVDSDAIQVAAYLSYATKAWFIDALAAYATVALDLARPTQTETVRGSTDAGVAALAVRGGYLFDLGKLRVGPIAGLSYVHGRVDGYTDTSNVTVGGQTIESFVGSAGVRFLAPFQAKGLLFVPYLNITLEHQFGSGTQTLTLAELGGPVGQTSFPAFDARNYGKLEGGLTIELAPEASISVTGATTFGREDGNDYRISTGLNYRF